MSERKRNTTFIAGKTKQLKAKPWAQFDKKEAFYHPVYSNSIIDV